VNLLTEIQESAHRRVDESLRYAVSHFDNGQCWFSINGAEGWSSIILSRDEARMLAEMLIEPPELRYDLDNESFFEGDLPLMQCDKTPNGIDGFVAGEFTKCPDIESDAGMRIEKPIVDGR
jgi:hypothetical protein